MAVTINTDYMIVTDSFDGEKIEVTYEDADGTSRYVADIRKYGAMVRLIHNEDEQAGMLMIPAELAEAIGDEQRELRRQLKPFDGLEAMERATQLTRGWSDDVVRVTKILAFGTTGHIEAERMLTGETVVIATLRDYNDFYKQLMRDQAELHRAELAKRHANHAERTRK